MVTFTNKELGAIYLSLKWTLDWFEGVAVKDGDLSFKEAALRDALENAMEKIIDSGEVNDSDMAATL